MSLGAFANLSGIPIAHARVDLPFAGLWHADVSLTQDLPASPGPQTLTVGDLLFTCTIVRDTPFAGARRTRLIGGTGGWRRRIGAQQYASSVGIPTSVILNDAALAAGEFPPVLSATVPTTLGTAWVRQAGAASLVLWSVLGTSWWLDNTGLVQTAARASSPITSVFQAIRDQGAPGIVTVATDTLADWTPGRTFTGPTISGTINRVMHIVDPERVRTEVTVSS